MKQGKRWGTTELIFSGPNIEFHKIDFNKGGKCSVHVHEHKYNGFYVSHGILDVRVWELDDSTFTQTRLRAGDFMVVKPLLMHQFRGATQGCGFELYWTGWEGEDVLRKTINMRHEEFS